jgi:hypothetical protein
MVPLQGVQLTVEKSSDRRLMLKREEGRKEGREEGREGGRGLEKDGEPAINQASRVRKEREDILSVLSYVPSSTV